MLRTFYYILLFSVLAVGQNLYAQDSENVNLKLQWNPGGIPGIYNDCWGYTAPDGSEYGIAGSSTHIHFFDMTDMDNISEVERLTPGASSSWRDFKTYQEYAYGVVDSGVGEGLVIMDLSSLPLEVTYEKDESDFIRAHNIFVDTLNARLYVVGSNTGAQRDGIILYDISDPGSPVLEASVSLAGVQDGPESGYVHDVYVRDNIAYCSHGNSGYWVWDFSQVTSSSTPPELLGGIDPAGSGYNHSSWLTGDGNYSYWCEETRGRKIHVADVSDLEQISVELQFSDPLIPGDAANHIAHNPFIRDTLLYISYYEDGVQIYNISDPLNPERVGYYDTDLVNTGYNGTDNNWGVYPYFSGEKIIATDTDNGVFFLEFDPVSALLPVELISWNGQIDNGAALLSWSTAQEQNSDFYEIEHSTDNRTFRSIGSVESQKNSTQVSKYTYTHAQLTAGKNYYRLKMVDQDGSFTYSSLIDLNYLLDGSAWFIYPNPSHTQFNVDVPESESNLNEALFKLYDIKGAVSLTGKTTSSDQNTLQIHHNLPAGMYVLEVQLADGQYHREQIAVY